MNSNRGLLALALLFISFLVYQQWEMDKAPKPVVAQTSVAQSTTDTPTSATGASNAVDSQAQGRIITVSNDVFQLKIDTLGGDVVESDLLAYAKELNGEERFALLEHKDGKTYVAQSGLVGKNGIDTAAGRAQ